MFDINLNYKNPAVYTWNFAVQRALPGHVALDVTYAGLHGADRVAQWNLNAPTSVVGGGTASMPLDVLFGKTAGATLFWDGCSSSCNALQVKLDRNFGDFLLTTAFTWGKGTDYQSDDGGGLQWEIGAQAQLRAHGPRPDLEFHTELCLPVAVGVGKHLLSSGPATWVPGNWQLSGILTALTGTPFFITASGSSLNTPRETQTASQVAPVRILHGINTGNQWFSTASLTQPTGVAIGTSGHNILSGPGLFALNLSLFKSFKSTSASLSSCAPRPSNLTNTPEFSNSSNSLTSSTYGYVTSTIGSGTGVSGTGGGRALQLGVKVSF